MRLLVICFSLVLVNAAGAAADATWTYRGFRCDMAAFEHSELRDEMAAAVRDQIDIVCAVGVSPQVLDFFRTVPLVAETTVAESPARYGAGRRVKFSVTVVAFRHRPVLLHELLHAFHHQKLKDGTRNADLLAYYERAKQKEAYAPHSHMMDDVGEFFACAATTYLAGFTGQEPFVRENLRTNQPRFFNYLATLFGPDAGRYEGSHEAPDRKRLEKLKVPNLAPEEKSEETERGASINASARIMRASRL